MFFCKPCGDARAWPNSIFKSYGKCEMCELPGECNDVPSRYLPSPKPVKPELDINSIT